MQRDKSLDWMRAVLTILVVIGHSTFITISTKYGGMDYQSELISNGFSCGYVYVIASEIKAVIYKFHMPAFIALSGILYGRQYRSGKFDSLISLAKSKFNRLMIPFFMCWVFWNIPLKMISGYYLPINNNLWLMLVQMLNPYQVHLWYLEALFFIFVLHYIICKYVSRTSFRLLICAICYVGGVFIRYKYGAPLGNPLLYIIWFEVGFDRINEKADKLPIWFEVILFSICYIVSNYIQYSWVVFDVFLGFFGLDIVYKLSRRKTDISNSSKLLKLSMVYSFEIYLLSDSLNYVILYTWVQVFGITALCSNIMYGILLFIRISFTFFLPIILSVIYVRLKRIVLIAKQ